MTDPIREDVPLAPMTTLGVGGRARYFFEAIDEAGILWALDWARERGLDATVLGGGSNVVLADRGLSGLVVRVALRGVDVAPGDPVIVTARAGEPWDRIVARAVEAGWAGLECLSGIPGTVGAAPIQNVGAYGQEVAETIRGVRAIDRRERAIVTLDPEACAFSYRDSVFKGAERGRYVVVAVTFALRPDGAPSIRYPELARHLGAERSTLPDVRAAVLALRRSKSMVLDETDENRRSVGSFFVNPTVAADRARDIRARAERLGVLAPGERMPEFPAADGRVKLSAAWLIERAGFAKGAGAGPVGLSTRHSLAIVNRGGATAAEVVAFAATIRRGVRERFAVALTPEAQLVGFTEHELAPLVEP